MNYRMIMFRPSREVSPGDLKSINYGNLLTPDKIIEDEAVDLYTDTISKDYAHFQQVSFNIERWEQMESWYILKTFFQNSAVVCDRKDNFINQLSLLDMAKLTKSISNEFADVWHARPLEHEEFECLRSVVLFLAGSILDRKPVTFMGGDRLISPRRL